MLLLEIAPALASPTHTRTRTRTRMCFVFTFVQAAMSHKAAESSPVVWLWDAASRDRACTCLATPPDSDAALRLPLFLPPPFRRFCATPPLLPPALSSSFFCGTKCMFPLPSCTHDNPHARIHAHTRPFRRCERHTRRLVILLCAGWRAQDPVARPSQVQCKRATLVLKGRFDSRPARICRRDEQHQERPRCGTDGVLHV